MKLVESRTGVKQNFEGEQITFTMKSSAKAFHLVIAQLYSRPVEAVIRELSTNAYEAHQMVEDEDVPFDVYLPTVNELDYIIRDFGPGLTPEQFKSIYSVVFESTKSESNDVDGCFGLGSKSPFAYTQSYIVESFVNGKHYIYFVCIGDDGIPRLTLGDESDTTELNGVKITIPVAEKDIREFSRAAIAVYQYFKVRPNIVRGGKLTFNDKAPIEQTSCVKFFNASNYYNGGSESRVIMGNVSYPLDSKQVPSPFNSNIAVHITVPRGSVSPAPSREMLAYDANTIKSLKHILETARKEFLDKHKVTVDKCESIYSAYKKTVELSKIISNNVNSFEWRGKTYYAKDLQDKLNVGSFICSFNAYDVLKGRHQNGVYTNYQIYIVDVKSYYMQAIAKDMKEKGIGDSIRVQLWNEPSKKTNNEGYTQEEFDSLIKDKWLSASDYVLVSKIDIDKSKIITSTRNRKKTKILQYNPGSTINAYAWKDLEVTDEELEELSGYYVLTYNNKIINQNGEKVDSTLLTSLEGSLLKGVNIYAVTKANEKILDNTNLESFIDYIAIQKDILKKNAEEYKVYTTSYYNSSFYLGLSKLDVDCETINEYISRVTYVKSCEKHQEAQRAYETICQILTEPSSITNMYADKTKIVSGNEEQKIKKLYPLLNLEFINETRIYINHKLNLRNKV